MYWYWYWYWYRKAAAAPDANYERGGRSSSSRTKFTNNFSPRRAERSRNLLCNLVLRIKHRSKQRHERERERESSSLCGLGYRYYRYRHYRYRYSYRPELLLLLPLPLIDKLTSALHSCSKCLLWLVPSVAAVATDRYFDICS